MSVIASGTGSQRPGPVPGLFLPKEEEGEGALALSLITDSLAGAQVKE